MASGAVSPSWGHLNTSRFNGCCIHNVEYTWINNDGKATYLCCVCVLSILRSILAWNVSCSPVFLITSPRYNFSACIQVIVMFTCYQRLPCVNRLHAKAGFTLSCFSSNSSLNWTNWVQAYDWVRFYKVSWVWSNTNIQVWVNLG